MNVERLIRLHSEGLLHPSVEERTGEIREAPFVFPEDILAEIRRDGDAWKNYQLLPEPYLRIRISHIDSARDRPDEFRKRLSNFVKATAEGRMIGGYGGTDAYYRTRRLLSTPFVIGFLIAATPTCPDGDGTIALYTERRGFQAWATKHGYTRG